MKHYREYRPVTLPSIGDHHVDDRIRNDLAEDYIRGIPFHFKASINLCSNGPRKASIGLDSTGVYNLSFAHRLPPMSVLDRYPPGMTSATYTLTYSDGTNQVVPIRAGFEIASLPTDWTETSWDLPALAFPDRNQTLPPRFEGPFALAGFRQTEVWNGISMGAVEGRDIGSGFTSPWSYFVYNWANPWPDKEIKSVDIELSGASEIMVGALTVGHFDESPFSPEPTRPLAVELPNPLPVDEVHKASITIDRGHAGFLYPVIPVDTESSLQAWGKSPQSSLVTHAYTFAGGTPSSTVSLMFDGKELESHRWSELRSNASTTSAMQLKEASRVWVRTVVRDSSTSETLPCRIRFTYEGIPFPPHGHHAHVNNDLPSWNSGIGGDVRLGRQSYAYIDGECEGWLPLGDIVIEVARGYQYEPRIASFTIDSSTTEIAVELDKLDFPPMEVWTTADTHVHFASAQGALYESTGEGIDITHVLASKWGRLFTGIQEFTGTTYKSQNHQAIAHVGQENRQHFLGHLSVLGIHEPIYPITTDGPDESDFGSGLETTLSDWAARCRAQGGIVVIPHFPSPNGEQAALLILGLADALESIGYKAANMAEYYTYLNAGFQIPLVGGTDKMTSDVPIGLMRTLSKNNGQNRLTMESWAESVKTGQTYVTSGPLLDFQINDAEIGDTVSISNTEQPLEVTLLVKSIFPIQYAEILVNGEIIKTLTPTRNATFLNETFDISINDTSWCVVRVFCGVGDNAFHHTDERKTRIMAHSSPIYITVNGKSFSPLTQSTSYIKQLLLRSIEYLENNETSYVNTQVVHRHNGDHLSHLLAPFYKAFKVIEMWGW